VAVNVAVLAPDPQLLVTFNGIGFIDLELLH